MPKVEGEFKNKITHLETINCGTSKPELERNERMLMPPFTAHNGQNIKADQRAVYNSVFSSINYTV